MDPVETALRLLIIGQQVLLALVCLVGSGNRGARLSCALLLASVSAYLVATDAVLFSSLSAAAPLIVLLSISVPYLLWSFAKCIFDAPAPPTWVVAVVVLLVAVEWSLLTAFAAVDQQSFAVVFAVKRIVAIGIVLHVIWMAVAGRGDDLLEKRRRFRVIFVVLIAIQAIVVLAVELAIGTAEPPRWLSMLNVIEIGILTTGLAVAVLRLDADFIPDNLRETGQVREPVAPDLPAADRVLKSKLLEAMEAGVYRKTGLTITQLAAELRCPEHQLRRLINRHLGYRNFSAFLNSYRVGEARHRLADPSHARTPVLTLALDLGYASLGPFNRAFKAATGATPTEYRERAISAGADSE